MSTAVLAGVFGRGARHYAVNNESRVAQDPDRAARLAMENVLKLS
jgi:hypothetical protein